MMKTIQMTLDEELVTSVDKLVKKFHTSRSEFTRLALKEAIKKFQISKLEKKHIAGYSAYPVAEGEFDVWGNEQAWGKD